MHEDMQEFECVCSEVDVFLTTVLMFEIRITYIVDVFEISIRAYVW